MSTEERMPNTTARPSSPDDRLAAADGSDSQQLPPEERELSEQPGDVGSPHRGQSGKGGSGKDASLQSIGQSQSDRAAGSSR